MPNGHDAPDDFDARKWFLEGQQKIDELRGNIFSFAQQNCDACALWLSSGLVQLETAWCEFIAELETRQASLTQLRHDQWRPIGITRASDHIWAPNPFGALLRVEPATGNRLRHVYVLPNLKNEDFLSDATQRQDMVIMALEAMNDAQAKVVAMNRIPGSDPDEDEPVEDNIFEAYY